VPVAVGAPTDIVLEDLFFALESHGGLKFSLYMREIVFLKRKHRPLLATCEFQASASKKPSQAVKSEAQAQKRTPMLECFSTVAAFGGGNIACERAACKERPGANVI
jgi:hypothetical protein